MGNQEDVKSNKSEKPSTPEALNRIHVYPDWTAAQAYYGPRVALPPYYNSTLPSGYASHPYFWCLPQHIIPPYGTPYAATYAQGGLYAHPPAPTIPTPVSGETPSKSSGDASRGLMKKLKSVNRPPIVEAGDSGAKPRVLESTESEGTSDGSDGNTSGADKIRRKRMHLGTPPTALSKSEGGSALDVNLKMPSEAWLLSERDLKRERRKQSNRESARRSRLRKQAESEELANRVGYLTAENAALTVEMNRLVEDSDNLRRENAKLMEKLKHSKPDGTGDEGSDTEVDETLPIATENLLSRVENASEASTEEEEAYDQKVQNLNSGTKLLQLLATKSRVADAVAAT